MRCPVVAAAQSGRIRILALHGAPCRRYLEELRRPYYGVPLNVSFTRAIFCFVLSILAAAVSLTAVVVLGAVKFAPVLLRALYLYTRLLTKMSMQDVCLWGLFWLIGLGFVPVAVVLAYALVVLLPLGYIGPTAAIHGYYAAG